MSKTLNNNISKIIIPVISAIAIIAMALIGIMVYGAQLSNLLIFGAFILLYVQLPGLLINKFIKLPVVHMSTRLLLGLFSGWALETLVYFINDLNGNNILLYIVGPCLSIAYVAKCIKLGRKELTLSRFNPTKLSSCFCIFFVCILLYSLINTQYLYLSPELADFTHMNPDKAYHMGLINSLSHSYPLQSPWVQGAYINYHFFTEILYSIPVRLFGLGADFILMSCGAYLTAYTCGLAFYSFFKEMSSKPHRAGIYCLLLFASNIYVTRNIRTSLAFTFILINDNAAGYGIAATLATLILLKLWYEQFNHNDKRTYVTLILLTMYVMLTTGIKGPMGAVLIASLWGTYLLGLILKKVPAKLIAPLILLTVGFYIVYHFVLGSKGQSNANGASFIAPATIIDIAFWKKPLIALLKRFGTPRIIRLVIVLFVYIVVFFSAYFLPFILGYLRELYLVLSKKRDFNLPRIVIYAECCVGFICLMILNYSGHSQIYFGLVTAFLAPMVAYWFFEDMELASVKSKLSKFALRLSAITFGIAIVLSTYQLGVYFKNHYQSAVNATNAEATYNKYTSISNSEYEAMRWVEQNTDQDSVIATDRYYSVDPINYSIANRWDNRFFLYSVYSNRYFYIEGSGYNIPNSRWADRLDMVELNNKLYDVNNESRGELANELDIDYVIVSKRFTNIPDLTNDDYSKCFENEDIIIYKIS